MFTAAGDWLEQTTKERYTLPPSVANGKMRERLCEDIKVPLCILVTSVFKMGFILRLISSFLQPLVWVTWTGLTLIYCTLGLEIKIKYQTYIVK